MSYKDALIRLLDRRGGRFLLGKIASRAVQQRGGHGVEIAFIEGFWTRRVGSNFFPDSARFNYTYADFNVWACQTEQYAANTTEYWLQHYHAKEGDVIIDVGAGHGEDTFTFSRIVGKRGRVIAIEAHPLSFEILRRFCRLNGLSNVTPLQLALMDKAGTVHIAESESSWMENAIVYEEGSVGIEVRAGTLDEVCREQVPEDIALLKMNIEGAERFALLGMEKTIARVRQICVACHDFRSDQGHGEHFRTRAFVKGFLCDHGFTVVSRSEDPRQWVRDHVFGLRA